MEGIALRIFVITKRTLVIAAIVLIAVIAAVIIAIAVLLGNVVTDILSIAVSDGNATAAGSMAVVEEYELEVLAGKKRELPVYSVERDDKKIALTIDAAWEDDKTDFILETLKSYNVKATFFLCGFWVEKYPEKVKAIYDAGHEVKITGEKTKVFRAPYGEYNDSVITTVRSLGYEVLQWDLDTVDMKWKPVFSMAVGMRQNEQI